MQFKKKKKGFGRFLITLTLVNHIHLWITYYVPGYVQGTRDTIENIMIKMEQNEMMKASKTQEVGWICLKL